MTLLEKQLTEQVQQLTETISTLNQTIAELNQTIAELRERLNKNSSNSSKPPSTDGYEKPNPKSLRKPSGRKAGGQEGHKGHHLNIEQAPNEIVSHMPSACTGCPYYEECRGKSCVAETRKVADAFIEIQVTAHEALRVNCPLTGKTLRGSFPSDVKGPVQYGKTLQGPGRSVQHSWSRQCCPDQGDIQQFVSNPALHRNRQQHGPSVCGWIGVRRSHPGDPESNHRWPVSSL